MSKFWIELVYSLRDLSNVRVMFGSIKKADDYQGKSSEISWGTLGSMYVTT